MKLLSSAVARCISSSENTLNAEVLGILIFANEGIDLWRFSGGGFVESGSKHTDVTVVILESSNGFFRILRDPFAGIDAIWKIMRDKRKKKNILWVM